MKGLEQIRVENREAAEKVKEEGIEPLEMTATMIKRLQMGMIAELQEIPFVGDASFDDYEEEKEYFVDASGMGQVGEAALTVDQFIDKLESGLYYAITSIGQFQVFIQEYSKEA